MGLCTMKLVPGHLPPIPTSSSNTSGDRLSLPLPFNADLLWRYPLGFPPLGQYNPPSSPLLDYKSQLPASLPTDPRVWSREDVATFLRWAEQEFDIQPIDHDMFQMNGKAMCLLTRTDLAERAPGSGDVLHNVLQILVREANLLHRILPSSPVTPTSRHPYPLSPHAPPTTPTTWAGLGEQLHQSHAALAAHLMAQSNSTTLSPAPSVDSQAGGSPQHGEGGTFQNGNSASAFGGGINASGSGSGSGSNHSDSDEDGMDKKGYSGSPPNTPSAYSFMPQMPYMPPRSPKDYKESVSSPSFKTGAREFFPDSPEPNTNGRLLWDFLQQLLNDPAQRYTSYIAWKNRETGVFKIVDPSGLAKLWGIQKNHLSMNYDKMSRALRYYYRVNILRKVQGERHCYQFLRNPTELKNIKNISLLRQQMSPTNTKPPQNVLKPEAYPIKSEPGENPEGSIHDHHLDYEDKPTDLSMEGPTDLSSTSRHVNIVCSPDPPIPQNHH
ncbi:unnamed protein product [Acanthoscelides obtectus]|uniref:Ets DNA-binding protein pokkuri n=2 Tax=Acanthoscelides obtectus TaxID=200917 RepID=A0A9P0KW88_ACAOB|nr:unnamed protein product [Acanthoscelides obtectus]CAK1623421.1 Ets DNA-binding protein pokkuri [Acanthoscelides obtectus]